MNERIKLLAEQAGFETNEAICSFGNYKIDNEYFFAEDFIEDELAKFAELIIRKCLEIMDDEDDYAIERSARMAAHRIKEHFGVEE